ncbi:MAG: hypothetical protein LC130_15930 [Bryobacterales bacterium]|nr:hypothetical protein [Bryobacterales bacterium]
MSEAELHVLRARLQGGIRNKARRGELFVRPPMGFVYNADGKMVVDPDQQVQQSVRLLFETFRRTGSAMAVVRLFAEQGLQFPRRVHTGPNQGGTSMNKTSAVSTTTVRLTERTGARVHHGKAPPGCKD